MQWCTRDIPAIIALQGDSITHALPAGPALPQKAIVTQGGSRAAGRGVTIELATGESLSGTTDANGEFVFTYVPPYRRAVDVNLKGKCVGCSNEAAKTITVLGVEINTCPADPGTLLGNPISPSAGVKMQDEADWDDAGAHALSFSRHYRSSGRVSAGLGGGWAHNFAARVDGNDTTRLVRLGGGADSAFTRGAPGLAWLATNGVDALTQTADGWVFNRAADDSRWTFDGTGRLMAWTARNGWTHTLAWSGGLLSSVTNAFGRQLQFSYDGAARLVGVALPDGRALAYGYDGASRLAQARRPDGGTVQYLYENPGWPMALTGIIDESGQRIASFAYDAEGRAIGSQHALGTQAFAVAFDPPPVAVGSLGMLQAGAVVDANLYRSIARVTDPLGTLRAYQFQGGDGTVRLLGSAGAYDGASIASRTFDARAALPSSETDFLGITTQYVWDAGRQLRTGTTRAAGRAEAQSEQVQWHPSWRLPVLSTESGRTTALEYDARGNKTRETVTDLASGQSRGWSWSWNAQGLVESMTDPRGATWRYEHDGAGNRVRETNPLGHVTTWAHDSAGRVVRETAPNGLITRYTWDARGRLIQADVGGEISTWSYLPTGQLAGHRTPGGLELSYAYDAAQRLVGASDNRGNRIAYTLDAMGNRVREEVRDAGGALALATGRVIDTLNRVAAVQGAAGQTTQYAYDANGELASQTDPLNQTTRQGLDALRRPVSVQFPDNAVATQQWNALDQLTRVTDPKGVGTVYERNAFGEIVSETSPDSGTTRYVRDAGGLIIARTDARGQTSTWRRDLLGRVTEVTHADGKTETWRHDASPALGPNQTGHLVEIEDSGAITRYERDLHGRVTAKTQHVRDNPAAPSAYRVGYVHAGGQLARIDYPGGLQVHYNRDASGQIRGIDVTRPGAQRGAFVTDLAYTALGQPRAWTWRHCAGGAPCDGASRSFDADGRMTATEFSRYGHDAAGRITSLSQELAGSAGARTLSWNVGYDNRGRIARFTRVSPGAASTAYTWDANGNRVGAIDSADAVLDLGGVGAGLSAQQTSRAEQASRLRPENNRLLGFEQTLTITQNGRALASSSVGVGFTLDAAGNLTGDGLRQYDIDGAGRIERVRVGTQGEEAQVRYLHNALGQRVFKSEVTGTQAQPSEQALGADFVAWLQRNFGWLFGGGGSGQALLGQAYVHDEAGRLLSEVGSDGQRGQGRVDIVWLPVEAGEAVPVGLHREGRLYAIHADHLGTPRRIVDDAGGVAWQWPYSAMGQVGPTGVLKATGGQGQGNGPNANASQNAAQATQERLERTEPAITVNLRFPGQYFDAESGLHYNYFRSYMPGQGRYTQADPIGLEGGLNGFLYAEGSPLMFADPDGLEPDGHHWVIGPIRNDPGLSKEARDVFRNAKTGWYGERHGWDKPHAEYNKAVKDLWDKNNYNKSCMTRAQAEDFVQQVKEGLHKSGADVLFSGVM